MTSFEFDILHVRPACNAQLTGTRSVQNLVKTSPVVAALLLINIAIFVADEWLQTGIGDKLTLYSWLSDDYAVTQLVSYMFVHGGFTHLFFNMFALWMFGPYLERVWGSQRFLFFYLCCGIGASLVQLWVNEFQFNQIYQTLLANGVTESDLQAILDTGRYYPAQVGVPEDAMNQFYGYYYSGLVGASGAIYGLLVAFAIMFPNVKLALIFLPVPIAAKYFVPVLLLIDLAAGITGFSLFSVSVAHFAHLGGALIGFLLMMLWWQQRR